MIGYNFRCGCVFLSFHKSIKVTSVLISSLQILFELKQVEDYAIKVIHVPISPSKIKIVNSLKKSILCCCEPNNVQT